MDSTIISPLQVSQTLSREAHDYLIDILGYSAKVAGSYQRAWRRIFEFMLTNGISDYNEEVAQQFLQQAFGKRSKKELSAYERFRYNGAKMLAQFAKTRKIDTPNTPTKPKTPPRFTGAIGEQIIQFLNYKRDVQGLSKIRLRCYERTLSIFLSYCQAKDIASIKSIDLPVLLRYLKDLDGTQKTAVYT